MLGSISSRAVLKAKTAYAYNAGSEWEENGIEYYHTFYRKYDAQIGRFTGVDIASEEYAGLTPFQFGANNPVLFNDPFGDRLPTLNTNGDGSEQFDPMQDLGNDLSWGRERYNNVWGWQNLVQNSSGGFSFSKWSETIGALWISGSLTINGNSSSKAFEEIERVAYGIALIEFNLGMIPPHAGYVYNYNRTLEYIFESFSDVFKINRKEWKILWKSYRPEHSTHPKNDRSEVYSEFSTIKFEQFISKPTYGAFGILVREIYHEYIHYRDRIGRPIDGISAHREDELQFRGMYFSMSEGRLPPVAEFWMRSTANGTQRNFWKNMSDDQRKIHQNYYNFVKKFCSICNQ